MVPNWREGVSICRSARTATWTVNVNERGEINKRRRSFHADGEKLREWQTVLWQDARPLLKAVLGGRSKDPAGSDYSHFEPAWKKQNRKKKSLGRRAVPFPGTYCCSISTLMWVSSLRRQHGEQRVSVLLQAGCRLTEEFEWSNVAGFPQKISRHLTYNKFYKNEKYRNTISTYIYF